MRKKGFLQRRPQATKQTRRLDVMAGVIVRLGGRLFIKRLNRCCLRNGRVLASQFCWNHRTAGSQDGLGAQLQEEGAQAFDDSWNELMKVIASKSANSTAGVISALLSIRESIILLQHRLD